MCVCLAPLIQSRLSPCGHVFCASCLVSWFSVAQEVNEDPYEERRTGLVRRKKVCPSCRAQIVSPPLELWALKDVLAAIHNYRGTAPSTSEIQQSLWDGLFDPTTSIMSFVTKTMECFAVACVQVKSLKASVQIENGMFICNLS